MTSETALQFLSAISYYKNTGEPKQAQILLDANQRPFFEAVLAAYEQRRKKALLLDFDDMLFECYHLLTEDGQILSKWQKQFSYILIDEFQDINQRQYDIVKLLALPENNLFVVGDDDQSIYGFRGSKPELMKDFLHNYRTVSRFCWILITGVYHRSWKLPRRSFSKIKIVFPKN